MRNCLLTLLALGMGSWVAWSQEKCPDSQNLVVLEVAPTVSKDGDEYLYVYRVKSSRTSQQMMNRFVVSALGPTAVASPPGWRSSIGQTNHRPTVYWSAATLAIVDGLPDDGPPSPAALKPGQVLSGFSFHSPYPSLTTRFYATGHVPPQVASSHDSVEELGALCPGRVGPLRDIAVSGVTLGPVDPDINRDGIVDGTDQGIVRASFGVRCGKAQFDERADVNHDCVVDVRDLSFVSRYIGQSFPIP